MNWVPWSKIKLRARDTPIWESRALSFILDQRNFSDGKPLAVQDLADLHRQHVGLVGLLEKIGAFISGSGGSDSGGDEGGGSGSGGSGSGGSGSGGDEGGGSGSGGNDSSGSGSG